MKRSLIAIAAVALTLGTSIVRADNNFTFDDPYWKRSETAHSAQIQVHAEPAAPQVRGPYDLVDNYNP